MNTNPTIGYSEFIKQKQELIDLFSKEMSTVLTDMGEDVKGISWFSSISDEFISQKLSKAA
jgi:hypothetical protein